MIIDNKIEPTPNAYKLPRGRLSILVFVYSMSVQGIAYSQENQHVNTWSINQKKLVSPEFVEADEELSPQAAEPLSQSVEPSIEPSPKLSSSEENQTVELAAIPVEDDLGAKAIDNDAPSFEESPLFESVATEAQANEPSVESSSPNAAQEINPNVIFNSELKDTLDRQFLAILKLEESADSFSEQFGELYVAYARTLVKAGRFDDARKMYAQALHNVKINNGVNAREQRSILSELFDMSLSIGNSADAEKHLKRLLWIDSEYPEDTYSFDMTMQLANYYLDQFLMTPVATEASLIGLNKSIRYFSHAVRRYGETSIKSSDLPYGDIAYAHYLKAQIRAHIDPELYVNARKRSYTDLDENDSRRSIDNSFGQSNRFLRQAFSKAKSEKDYVGAVEILLALGDIHLLYHGAHDAIYYYQEARKAARHLPENHPIVSSFSGPVKLPAFKLSVDRTPLSYGRSYQIVPMLLDIKKSGYVGTVTRQLDVNIPMGVRIRAKETAKLLRFRPIIEADKLVAINDHQYDIQVSIRNRSALANKEIEE